MHSNYQKFLLKAFSRWISKTLDTVLIINGNDDVDADDDVVVQPTLAPEPSDHPTLFKLRPRREGQVEERLHRRSHEAHQGASKS